MMGQMGSMGTKINAQVTIKNLQNMPVSRYTSGQHNTTGSTQCTRSHFKVPPTGARKSMELETRYQDWSWSIRTSSLSWPACKARDHTQADTKTSDSGESQWGGGCGRVSGRS